MATNIYGNGTTTATAGENTIVHYYDRAGIKAANRTNVYGQFADAKQMPKKMGKTFKISRFEHMYDRKLGDADFAAKGFMTARTADDVSASLTSAQLAEGAGATNQRTLTKVTVETSVARYGEMIDYTDDVDLFSEDYIQVRYREELGELANSRYEDLMQLDMLATGTVIYSGTATAMAEIGDSVAADGSDDADFKVSYDLIRKSVRKLVRNRAKKNTSIITGSTKIGTTPVASAYYGIIGADVKSDLEVVTDSIGNLAWTPVHKYGNGMALAQGEVGAVHEARFIESESAIVYAQEGATVPTGYAGSLSYTGVINTDAKFDVYPILFPTEGSFATVGLKGVGKIKFNAMSPLELDRTNPYGNQGFFSYNFWYAGLLLREECMLKVLVGASI